MGDLVGLAEAILSQSSRRVEVASQNIANITTPGYKSRASFQQMMSATSIDDDIVGSSVRQDWTTGKIVATRDPFDLAISGDGFFAVRDGQRILYTRDGQFQQDADGHLVNAAGMVLQGSGGDIVVEGSGAAIAADGSVTVGGKDAGRITLVDFSDRSALTPVNGGCFAAEGTTPTNVASPRIVQGAIEQSNASNATDMLTIMASLRGAESGQRIVQLYDDLMSQAATGFGQGLS